MLGSPSIDLENLKVEKGENFPHHHHNNNYWCKMRGENSIKKEKEKSGNEFAKSL